MNPPLASPGMTAPAQPVADRAANSPTAGPLRLGVTAASYGVRLRADHPTRFRDAIDAAEHLHRLGAGGMQWGVADGDPAFTRRLRERLEESDLYFEGQIGLPKMESDVPRFERQIRAARELGASVVRTVALSGRRYETFKTAEAFQEFVERSWQSLRWAEPVVRAHRVKLAVENHKDWLIPGLLDILRRMSSEHIGVCVDTGNSISLLEDPMEVVEAYAPFAMTCHFKDMGVQAYEDGFLLSEVPLGEGFLDLPRMITVLRKANPKITFNLEMITRDPLRVPCLLDSYWATLTGIKATRLAETLAQVKLHPPARALPRVSGKTAGEQIDFEEANNAACFAYARAHLGFA